MTRWRIENAKPAHIPAISSRMRAADVREVWASDRWLPGEALEKSLQQSVQAWTCLLEDVPAFMWGVCGVSESPHVGVPWLLSTDDIHRVSREFLRQSRAYVERMQAHFPRLQNRVHAENTISIRWLRWCGFTLNAAPETINGESFYSFWRLRNA